MTFFQRIRQNGSTPAAAPGPSSDDSLERRASPRPTVQEEAAEEARISHIPAQTLAFCTEHRLPPVPAVYELVYTHIDGSMPALDARISELRQAGPLTFSDIMALHDEFIRDPVSAVGLGQIREGLGQEVDAMTGSIAHWIETGRGVSEEMHRLGQAISRAATRQQLRDISSKMHEVSLSQIATMARMGEAMRTTQNRLAVLERELIIHSEAANTDHLTGLANRRAIDARIAEVFRTAETPGAATCFIMFDIDRFKAINDTHGHDVGDNILKKLGEVIRNCSGADTVTARWGGEEFALLVLAGGVVRASSIAERIRVTLSNFVWTRRNDHARIGVVTTSVGISIRRDNDTVQSFVKRADEALYRAKSNGRNRTYSEEVLVGAGDEVTDCDSEAYQSGARAAKA